LSLSRSFRLRLISLYCSIVHPPLHSFPTRRSSDLSGLLEHALIEHAADDVDAGRRLALDDPHVLARVAQELVHFPPHFAESADEDRKSTRLNSSHSQISYAVFCLKKKTNKTSTTPK